MINTSIYMDWEVWDFVFNNIEEGHNVFPIRLTLEKRFAVSTQEAKEVIAEVQEDLRKRALCEKIGCKWRMWSHFTPESGTEYYECKRCKDSGEIRYY